MRRIVLVCAGGFCGTLARYLVSAPLLALAALLLPGQRSGFPYDILFINLAGALAMGLLYGLFERGVALSPAVRVTLGTGFLGAFTTFSSLAYGGDKLLLAGAPLAAVAYFALSMGLGVLCARLGVELAAALADRRRLVRRVRARMRARVRATGRRGTSRAATSRTAAHGHVQPHTLAAHHLTRTVGASHHTASHAAHPHDHPHRRDQLARRASDHHRPTRSAIQPEEALEED